MWAPALLTALFASTAAGVTQLGSDLKEWHDILRSDGLTHIVLAYDSTQENGALNLKAFKEKAPTFDLFANAYAVDVSEHPWVSRAHGLDAAAGFTHLIYPPSSFSKAAASGGLIPRPGGVKKKPAKLQIPVGQLKTFLQAKLPEPKKVKKLQGVKSEGDVLAEIKKDDNHAELRYAVLFSDKDKVSPVLKAVAMRGGSDIARIIIAKASNAESVGLEKLPTLTLYSGTERKVFTGEAMDRRSIEAFLREDPEGHDAARREALLHTDRTDMKLVVKKHLQPVTKITSDAQWQDEVLNPEVGLVLTAFLDEVDTSAMESTLATLAEVARAERSPIRSVTWASTAESYGIMERLGLEPGSLVFFTAKLGKWTRYTGAPTAKGIATFVRSIGSSRSGSRNIGTLPQFGL